MGSSFFTVKQTPLFQQVAAATWSCTCRCPVGHQSWAMIASDRQLVNLDAISAGALVFCCWLQTVSICVAVSFGHSQCTWDPRPVWGEQRGRERQIKSNVRDDESLSSSATWGDSPKCSPKFARTPTPNCSCSCALSAYLLLQWLQCKAAGGVARFRAFNFS